MASLRWGGDVPQEQLGEARGRAAAAGCMLIETDGPRNTSRLDDMRGRSRWGRGPRVGPRIPQGRQRRLDRRNMALPSRDGHRGIRCMSARMGMGVLEISAASRVARSLPPHGCIYTYILLGPMHTENGCQTDSDVNKSGPYRMTLTLSDGRPKIGRLWAGLRS